MQPAALDDHLHQVADADGRNEPAFIGSYVQHRLMGTKDRLQDDSLVDATSC